jgi:hypothetical protein
MNHHDLVPRGSQSQYNLITSPNSNNVLFGGGPGTNEFSGNKGFQALIEQHKREYISTRTNKEKHRIATEIFSRIQSALGGRFLKHVKSQTPTPVDVEL